jgi:hypothetical protein
VAQELLSSEGHFSLELVGQSISLSVNEVLSHLSSEHTFFKLCGFTFNTALPLVKVRVQISNYVSFGLKLHLRHSTKSNVRVFVVIFQRTGFWLW